MRRRVQCCAAPALLSARSLCTRIYTPRLHPPARALSFASAWCRASAVLSHRSRCSGIEQIQHDSQAMGCECGLCRGHSRTVRISGHCVEGNQQSSHSGALQLTATRADPPQLVRISPQPNHSRDPAPSALPPCLTKPQHTPSRIPAADQTCSISWHAAVRWECRRAAAAAASRACDSAPPCTTRCSFPTQSRREVTIRRCQSHSTRNHRAHPRQPLLAARSDLRLAQTRRTTIRLHCPLSLASRRSPRLDPPLQLSPAARRCHRTRRCKRSCRRRRA